MAKIKPFRAYMPREGLADKIAALPYDVYDRNEACEAVKGKPLSFLNIDRAETQFDSSVSTYADEVYEKAHDLLWGMIEKGEFVQDERAMYYLYELTMDGRVQTGIVACASVDDYQNNVIKKHENTREEKELDRIRHVEACKAQTGPIFLAYRANAALGEIIAKTKKNAPFFDFTSEDGVTHRGWRIGEAADIELIERTFSQIGEIYIADGHHRCASAVKVGIKKRMENPSYTGDEEFNYFLSVLFADDELMIMDYNRVTADLNGLSKSRFLEEIGKVYEITKESGECERPSRKGETAMFLDNTWYLLKVRDEFKSDDPVGGLDVSILQDNILAPVLGITDPKTDKHIDFVGGIRGMGELERRVRANAAQGNMSVAFAMYPTSIQELFAVADAGLLMPPKSTWFEPKLRSGLFIHTIE